MEDSGALPLEMDVSNMNMGDVVEIYPYQGVAKRHGSGEELCRFSLKTEVILDEVQAGGRINLIIGRGLTSRARESLGLPASDVFRLPSNPPARVPRGSRSRRRWWARRAASTAASSPAPTASPR